FATPPAAPGEPGGAATTATGVISTSTAEFRFRHRFDDTRHPEPGSYVLSRATSRHSGVGIGIGRTVTNQKCARSKRRQTVRDRRYSHRWIEYAYLRRLAAPRYYRGYRR